MSKYDVICIGIGPASIFSCLQIIEKNPNLNILVLEKGKSLKDRTESGLDLTHGFGGSGLFSDSKLCFSTSESSSEYGGHLLDYVNDINLFLSLMKKVDDIYTKFSDDKNIKTYGDDLNKIEPIKINAAKYGINILSSRVKHIGTDNSFKIMEKVYNFMKDKVNILFNADVKNFIKKEKNFEVSYILNGKELSEKSKYLILAPGEVEINFFKKWQTKME